MFPLLSGIACLAVLASFAVPLWSAGVLEQLQTEQNVSLDNPLVWVLLFAFYFCNYFVIVFFNSALVACAVIRFRGGDPTVADGFRAAFARLPQIVAWALVSATVGVILKAIESRSRRAGGIAAGLLGAAWGIATYFVVPVLVVERVGPFQAVKRSLSVLRRAWGEAIVSNFGIGFIVFLLILVSLVPVAVGALIGSPVAIAAGVVVTILLAMLIALVSSALNAIVLGALYLYASEGSVPAHFDDQFLQHAFVQR